MLSYMKRNPLALVLGLSAIFFVLFLVISGVFFLSPRGSSSASKSGGLFDSGAVGIVEIEGVIMDSKKAVKRIEKFEEDSSVKAVVIRLNSPGGAVGPSQEIYEAVKKLAEKKPVVASMGAVAASGAFYISAGAKKVYANPGTLTGSIGVIMDFVNLEKLYEWARIKRYAIKTGKFKAAGAEYKEMTPEERELLETMLFDVLSQFKKAVADGRKLPMEEVTQVADGRIMSGAQAKRLKLIDEIGTLQDAINEAGAQGGLKGKPRVIYPESGKRRILQMLLDKDFDDEEASSRGSFIEVVMGLFKRDLSSLSREPAPGIYMLWKGAY
jgi:protease-4